jgi:hypothetical protein
MLRDPQEETVTSTNGAGGNLWHLILARPFGAIWGWSYNRRPCLKRYVLADSLEIKTIKTETQGCRNVENIGS